jgi:16S rRNA G966 N2-methylase RsmD
MKLVQQLQAAGQDHEFYPTTNEILHALFQHHFRNDDPEEQNELQKEQRFHGTVMDIGAGNGKVLAEFAKRGADTLYAIEKSPLLQRELPPQVLVIGTDFAEQSLFTKPVDLLFCNPPYSQFIGWMVKIIRTAAAGELYLVVPRRWQDNPDVIAALRFRSVFLPDEKDPKEPPPEPTHLDTDHPEYQAWEEQWGPIRDRNGRIVRHRSYYNPPPRVTIVGEFDFEDAEDRKARAKVHLLHIPLETSGKHQENDDAFERFFQEQFADLIARFQGQKEKPSAYEQPPPPPDRFPLVTAESYIEALVQCYHAELANIEKNYNAVATLDADLLREFEVYPSKIMACLKQRLSGLRHDYWHELFDRMDKLTSRLTTASRESMLGTLRRHVQVDFTVSNIHAIVLWALKNVNRYIDRQFIDTYEAMVEHCNIQNYHSNQRTWQKGDWRYNQARGRNEWAHDNTHFKLDYRIVLQGVGGIATYEYDFQKEAHNHLKEKCYHFLRDLLTIANNLGFFCSVNPYQLVGRRWQWQSNQREEFHWTPEPGKQEILFDARAFKNGNLHLRLHPRFILALNVEHGRLKGWLKDQHDAITELGDMEAAHFWKANLHLPMPANPALLLAA